MSNIKVHNRVFEPMIEKTQIELRVKDLANQLNEEYAEKHPIFLAVLNGAFIFAADLLRQINFPHEISFVKMSSYEGTQSTGKVTQLIGFKEDLRSRHVIILEDIVETGKTLKIISAQINELQPASIKVASLLVKRLPNHEHFPVDYFGFEIEDRFVLGYGLDYDGYGRNLSEIYAEKV